ncbi:DNA/RNA polymerase [Suillus brevipes Sb2]|nr:DNA/RNA polymerase [Suillus brevipes Sb2]
MIPVINGIEAPVRNRTVSVGSHTVATEEAVEERTVKPTVPTKAELNESIAHGQHFKRKGVWGRGVSGCSRTALWTETADPLPRPPSLEFRNADAMRTIRDNPSLFSVSTPIKIDVFESLLADHPNQPFVRSVCTGLREGFWPFANTHPQDWPLIHDMSDRPPKTFEEREFLKGQIEREVEVERYSKPFGPDLLPGMYSMPIHAVPKPGTDKHRLVTDHSAGKYALNSMISHEDIAGVTLDNVHDLANGLRVFRHRRPRAILNLWKADVSEAYRHMPMHPLWQVKQIVSFQGRRYVDCRNVFGGRASQRIYHAFMSLVIWIAIFKILIHFLYIYVDDSFSFEDKRNLELYTPYSKVLPSNMVKLLRLWDAIGLPHEERKQVFGAELPIIGFNVDANLMRACMSSDARTRLIQELTDFAQRGSRRSLRDFQRLAGWLNWALNVYPLLRPGLSALYAKTAGKLVSKALIWVNRDVVRELAWVVEHLRSAEGVFFFKSVSWSYAHLPDNVLRVYTDASGTGLAFWYPSLNIGFQSPLPGSPPVGTIFYFEALAVTAALLNAIPRLSSGQRIAVFTDNLNTVSMFNSLAALPPYNWLLMSAVDAILASHVDFRVFYIPGVENIVADHLSRWRNDEACSVSPGLIVHSFLPPRQTLGAGEK